MEITTELADSLREKFNTRVDKNGPLVPGMSTQCHVWIGSLYSTGYGRLSYEHVYEILAHRLAWVLKHGPIPDDLHVLHRCDNPPCVRYEHLFLGTNSDNIADKIAKGRQSRGTGAGGNKLTGLTDTDVIEIRRLRSSGATQEELMAMYDVGRMAIRGIVNNLTWKHLPPCESIDCRESKLRVARIDTGRRIPDSELRGERTENDARQKILRNLRPVRRRPS